MSCLTCQGPLHPRGGRKYCSYECYWGRPSTRVSVASSCLVCGNVVTDTGYGKRVSRRKLCSRGCIGELNRRRIRGTRDKSKWETVSCGTCGKPVERLKVRKTKQFCGRACRGNRVDPVRLLLKNGEELVVRSRWEAVFVQDFLEKSGLTWKYEPRFFRLPNGKRYTPDFYIEDDDLWVDVKGHIYPGQREKMEMFRDLGFNLLVADAFVLKNCYGLDLMQSQLEKRYGQKG